MANRPLTTSTVTRASRLMLPVHTGFAVVLGLIWLLQPARLGPGAAINALADVWPVRNTALILITLGLLEAAAQILRNRTMACLLLAAGAVVFVAIGAVLLFGHVPDASYSPPLWPWYVAIAHVASLTSLVWGENRESAA